MAGFKESQQQYTDAKKKFEAAANDVYLARQHLFLLQKRIDVALKELLVSELPLNHALQVELAATQTQLNAALAQAKQAEDVAAAAREAFKSHGTVTQTFPMLSDDIPVLLMPLRLQTRFLTTKHIARNIPENLLVDVNKVSQAREIRALFPDLRPPVDTEGRRALQAHSLSSHSSPTAKDVATRIDVVIEGPLFQKRWQKVEDSYELWVRIFPDDIFLETHESALMESEAIAARNFWQQMWKSERAFRKTPFDGAALKLRNETQLEAWKTLRFECLPHRATWAARVMCPAGYPDGFPGDLETIPISKFPVPAIKAESWTIPPSTRLLPEHFVINVFFTNSSLASKEIVGADIPDYLQTGFNPDEEDESAFADKGTILELPKELRWLTDLSEAEKCGMAVRIPLTLEEFKSGIAKIVVLGVKMQAHALAGGALFSNLMENHRYRPDSVAFLPQGTATNNLPDNPAGFVKGGLSAEDSFQSEFRLDPSPDPNCDGKRLTIALGVEERVLRHMLHYDKKEGEEALTINRALWPGTLGYYLDNLMRPAITDKDAAFAKSFCNSFVTARGLLPSFRIGKQPYGIVPSSAWSLWQAGRDATEEEQRIVAFLKKMDAQWGRLTGRVKTMKKVFNNTDEQVLKREFRELLACQASSTRYFRRLVAGEYLLWNINQRADTIGMEKAGIKTTPPEFRGRLEGAEGWNQPVNPATRILGKFIDDENYKLTDTPGDETPLPDGISSQNYLHILLDATIDNLKTQSFGENFSKFVTQRTNRLMFHLARFALLQGWIEAATNLLRKERANLTPFLKLDFEFDYITPGNTLSNEHKALLNASGLAGAFETIKNKWAFFEQPLANGNRVDATIIQKIGEAITADDPARTLKETRVALGALTDMPVDGLERLFSEHIDLCSFRLDSWLQGLALSRLFANRKKQGAERGLYLGSYGYVENLVPGGDRWIEIKEVTEPVEVFPQHVGHDNVVMPVFDFAGLTSLQMSACRKAGLIYMGSDPDTFLAEDGVSKKIVQVAAKDVRSEGGFLLTPSIEHAATAAILRAGYEHHQRSQGPESETLAVNVDTERTGQAMDMLKAINSGHSLNEQLGYFIERRMYDDAGLAQFVPKLREAFPLHIERNEWDDDQRIGEAEKVINLSLVTDGLAVVTKFQSPSSQPIWNDTLTEIFANNQQVKTAFEKVVVKARDQFDAVSDLVLAESVFQMVKGSPERAAAALRMTGDGSDITLPEVVKIPSESRILTHRTGFVFNSTGDLEQAWPTANDAVSIWVRLSPEFNRWLADHFPAPDKIFAVVSPSQGSPVKVSLASLGLQAVDFYYLLQKSGRHPEESLLAWLFNKALTETRPDNLRMDAAVSFRRNADFITGEYSVREIIPIVRTIGALLDKSRPMRPADWRLATGMNSSNETDEYDNTRLKDVFTSFFKNNNTGPIATYLAELAKARTNMEVNLPVGFGSPESDNAFAALIHMIPQAYSLGLWDATPRCPDECNITNAKILIDQATDIMEGLQKRLDKTVSELANLIAQSSNATGEQVFDLLSKGIHGYLGEDFLVLPVFKLSNHSEIAAVLQDNKVAASMGEFALEEWLQSVSAVRENLSNYQLTRNLRELFSASAAARRMKILQLPHVASGGNAWIGGKFPAGFIPPPNATSMAYEFSAEFVPSQTLVGILTDDWCEKVPQRKITAGVSINYNQNNSEAPQCLLLVVPPEQKGNWEWNALVQSVLETMNLAKKRAIDTEIIQQSWLNQFLPALVTPLDAKNNTPNLDFRIAGPALKPIVTGPRPGGIGGGLGGVPGGAITRM